ncbi:MAG: hypothetical protein OXI43_13455 [Candidatus Poribacteria bacterium]|nr:hypothetical protein [Candidatus Poribacteria bacterium]
MKKLQFLITIPIAVAIAICSFTTEAIPNDFDLGTQLGASLVHDADGTLSTISSPASVPTAGTSLPSLYITWYPNEYMGITPEASYGNSSDTGYIGYFGIRLSGLLQGYTVSTPYAAVDFSLYGIGLPKYERLRLMGLGGSLGYHFNINSQFICRVEAQYRRLISISDQREEANKVSLVISLGTLFSVN